MELVTSLSSYQEQLRDLKRTQRALESNCVLLAPALETLIRERRLYVRSLPGTMVIYIDQGNWYEMYYHREPDIPFGDLRTDKPVSVALLCRIGSEPSGEALLHAGFRLHKTSLHLTLDISSLSYDLDAALDAASQRLHAQGLVLKPCGSEFSQVHELWRANLDPTDIPLDHLSPRENAAVLCVYTESGNVAAATWWRQIGIRLEGRHTVTHQDYRRRGLSSALHLAQFRYARDLGVRIVYSWVSKTNLPSLAMFKNLGYSLSGRASIQYMLNDVT